MTATTTAAQASRALSFFWILVAYAVALAAAVATERYGVWESPLIAAAAADVVATVVVFGFSYAFRNSSFYDAYWSVAPPVLGVYFLTFAPADAPMLRQALALGLCTLWGVRLTYNWARGWTGLHHEDFRYVDIREKTGKLYWPVSFLGIHFFPTVQTFLGSLALWPALTATRPLGVLDAVAAVVTFGAIACESVADQQLRDFVKSPDKKPGELMMRGLWAYSRHPNYFGEMMFWWGLFLFGLAADPSTWQWIILGPLAISVMFFFVSIPMMETRQLSRKPAFQEHIDTTSMLVPWFRKRR